MNICVAQFAKSPETDRVKTRLIPPLSAEEATRLHKNMVAFIARSIASVNNVSLDIWSTQPSEFIGELAREISAGHKLQRGTGLGERLGAAMEDTLSTFDGVIFIGSDCPFITPRFIEQARILLQEHDIVIGPANDGGYVLLALKSNIPELFAEIDWGTEKVFEQTMNKVRSLSLDVSVLPALSDIDRPEDLLLLEQNDRLLELIRS